MQSNEDEEAISLGCKTCSCGMERKTEHLWKGSLKIEWANAADQGK